MAKRKHPTIKSLRQGQTVYLVTGEYYHTIRDIDGEEFIVVKIEKIFLNSHNTPLPPINEKIYDMPVNDLKKKLEIMPGVLKFMFYKREAAVKYARDNNFRSVRINDNFEYVYERF